MCLLSPAPFPEFLNIIDVDKDSRLALNCLARGHLIKHHTEKVAQHQRCLVEGHLFLRLVGLNCRQWPLQHWVWAVSAAQRHHAAGLGVGSVGCAAASLCSSGCGQCWLHSGITLQVHGSRLEPPPHKKSPLFSVSYSWTIGLKYSLFIDGETEFFYSLTGRVKWSLVTER